MFGWSQLGNGNPTYSTLPDEVDYQIYINTLTFRHVILFNESGINVLFCSAEVAVTSLKTTYSFLGGYIILGYTLRLIIIMPQNLASSSLNF